MFNVKDAVIIKNNGGKEYYKKTVGQRGIIITAYTNAKYGDVYYVRLLGDFSNEYMDNKNLWRCSEKMLKLEEKEGVNKMEKELNIIELWSKKQYDKLWKKENNEINKEELNDVNYANYKKILKLFHDTIPNNCGLCITVDSSEFVFDENVAIATEKIREKYQRHRDIVRNTVEEVQAQLNMCETYEQKQHILKAYGIIDEKGVLIK